MKNTDREQAMDEIRSLELTPSRDVAQRNYGERWVAKGRSRASQNPEK